MDSSHNSHLALRRQIIRKEIHKRLKPPLQKEVNIDQICKRRPVYALAKDLAKQAQEHNIDELDNLLSKMRIVLHEESVFLVEIHFNLFLLLIGDLVRQSLAVQVKKFRQIQDKVSFLIARALQMKVDKITEIVIDILLFLRPKSKIPEMKKIWATLVDEYNLIDGICHTATNYKRHIQLSTNAILLLRYLIKEYTSELATQQFCGALSGIMEKTIEKQDAALKYKLAILHLIRDFLDAAGHQFGLEKCELVHSLFFEGLTNMKFWGLTLECFALFVQKASQAEIATLEPKMKCFTVIAVMSAKTKHYCNLQNLSRIFINVLRMNRHYHQHFVQDETLRCFVLLLSEGEDEFQQAVLQLMVVLIEVSPVKASVIDYIDKVLKEEQAKRKSPEQDLEILTSLLYSGSNKVQVTALALIGLIMRTQLKREPSRLNVHLLEPVLVSIINEMEKAFQRNDWLIKEGLRIIKNAISTAPGQFYEFLYENNSEKLFYDVIGELIMAKNWDIVREATSVEAEMLQNPGFRDIEKEKGLIAL